jgi:hypothetical protein
MNYHWVKIEGEALLRAMTYLNGANIPTIGAGAHYGAAPPPGWDLTNLRARVEVDSIDDAIRRVNEALPPSGDWTVSAA